MNFPEREDAARAMVEAARAFYRFGWLLGTSGNLSVRLDPMSFLITASGKDKGALAEDDFLVCGLTGQPTEKTPHRPSAETLLHTVIYSEFDDVGAIYHVHEPYAALCSDRDQDRQLGCTRFTGLEMIKGLDIWEEDAVVDVPIVKNHGHIPDLAAAVRGAMSAAVPAVMVHNHGYYAWGPDAFAAKRHIETLAYLYMNSWKSGCAQP